MLREAKRLMLRLCGSRRGIVLNSLAVLFVAWGVPWFLGMAFLRAVVLIPLASLSVFLVADSVVASFPAGDSEDFANRICACVLVGWLSGLAIVAAGLVALSLMIEPALPPGMILLDSAIFSLAADVVVAGVALAIVRKFSSPYSARLVLKLLLLAAALLLLYGCNKAQSEGLLLPTDDRITRLTWIASVFFLANGAALIALASKENPK